MPGVKAILTVDDLPKPADAMTDHGQRIPANPLGERGLTNDPVYQGEPILAVCAVDELTAAEAIEKIKLDIERLPHVVDPLVSLRPGGPNARVEGNVWMRPAGQSGPAPAPPPTVSGSEVDRSGFRRVQRRPLPMGKATDPEWSFGDVEAGLKNAAPGARRNFVTPNTSHQPLETRTAMAYWQNGKVYVHCSTQSTAQTVPAIGALAANMDPDRTSSSSANTPAAVSAARSPAPSRAIIPALLSKKVSAPVMMRISREEEHYIGRARPSLHGRLKVGFTKEGRITAIDMFVVMRQRSLRSAGRRQPVGPHGFADVPAAGHALARRHGPDQHAAARFAEPAGRIPGHRAHGADPRPRLRANSASIRWRSTGSTRRKARRPSDLPTGKGKRALRHQRLHQGSAGQGRGAVRMGEAQSPAEDERQQGARHRRGHQLLRRRLGRLRRPVRHQARRQALHPVRHRQSRHGIGAATPTA